MFTTLEMMAEYIPTVNADVIAAAVLVVCFIGELIERRNKH